MILFYLQPDAPLPLNVDVSNTSIGAVLQQTVDKVQQPLGFFSYKLTLAVARYSTFGRELLVIYASIRHFRHLLEGRQSVVLTGHKPLSFAAQAKPDKYSPVKYVS
ncbi:unnamed protein product [Dicrocoelium dendriticum]|nr:unnamed protein product [Dicrocoelium dendriticum]